MPMSKSEKRAISGLSFIYIVRMLGLFMLMSVLSLDSAQLRGARPCYRFLPSVCMVWPGPLCSFLLQACRTGNSTAATPAEGCGFVVPGTCQSETRSSRALNDHGT
ncbi:hypothetical protein Acaty_1p0019 (plasmid) [Acidithiobacillus caldus ATCC 51756]|uniref:Uncharacterized protein n=1 Tax=Acidithiobacillus caldus (strain ATCC 51756 / DSM 8584 / KU) TaxID=637389 RepID=A0A059ZZ66_ACICK|nr:hypothetical protein Acaty_1p0019 [Acidithiobacillus caldus ATCC 51756]